MLDITRYLEDRIVKRERIALDIRDGRLSEADIDDLVSNHVINSAFIGDSFNNKKPVEQWNTDYLNELSYGVIAEGFNEDYLRYLYKVAEYVRNVKQDGKLKSHKKHIPSIIVNIVRWLKNLGKKDS